MFRLKVKEIAEGKGFSQYRLAKESGVNEGTIRKMYRNPHSVVNTATLDALAKTLGVDVGELLESVPDEPQS